jgi:hypothetical protein
MMNKENTEAQVKAQIIQRINSYKDEAIHLGYDYPTQPIEEASLSDLINFYEELVDYVAYNHGFNAAISGEELETFTTH